jgi:uncharacterized YccA/Bax inhibitor family protein
MAFNPVKQVFERAELYGTAHAMTLSGTLWKMGSLLALMACGGVLSTYLLLIQSAASMPLLYGAALIGVVLATVSVIWPHLAKYTALPYAFSQGYVVTMFSWAFESRYPGIALTALAFTSATAIAMLLLYRLEIIKVTETVRSVIIAATAAIGLTYLVVMLLGLFGFNSSAFFASSSLMSIGFSFFVVGIAAFNLLLDFSLIEESVENQLPKYMEWYAAFSLLATLIWLYIEILRLLVKLARRRD